MWSRLNLSHEDRIPWVLIGVWGVLKGLRRAFGIGLIFPYAVTIAIGLVMSFAVALALAAVFTAREPKWPRMLTLLFMLVLYCTNVGGLLVIPLGSLSTLSGPESTLYGSDKLERIHELRPSAARIAARIVYNELGVRLGYRSEDGSPTIFEPTSDEATNRREHYQRSLKNLALREQIADTSRSAQLQAIMYLAGLPGALIVVTAHHTWRRRRAVREAQGAVVK